MDRWGEYLNMNPGDLDQSRTLYHNSSDFKETPWTQWKQEAVFILDMSETFMKYQ